jgi:acyl transferase domain-containing protein
MGRELYASERVYRTQVDACAERLRAELQLDLRTVLFDEAGAGRLAETALAQPALFVTEYALVKLWESWGIVPAALVGHSVGEYVAACVAGVLTLEDALHLVAVRGRLMQAMPRGAMLAVELSEAALARRLGAGLWVSAVNGADICTVGGESAAIEALERTLRAGGHGVHRLPTSHAYHTPMMAEMVARYVAEVARVPRAAPRVPYVSSVTGGWVTAREVEDAAFWGRQVCEPVQFARGLDTALAEMPGVVVEVGPGHGLCRLIRRRGGTAYPSLGVGAQSDLQTLLTTLGQLWAAGLEVDWRGFYADERRHRVALPTYPFQRKRYWIDPPAEKGPQVTAAVDIAAADIAPPQPSALVRGGRPALRNGYVAPKGALERALADIVEAALGIHPVGVTDRFGELGGDSLQAVRIIDSINSRLGSRLDVVDLYDSVTIKDLIHVLAEQPHVLSEYTPQNTKQTA